MCFQFSEVDNAIETGREFVEFVSGFILTHADRREGMQRMRNRPHEVRSATPIRNSLGAFCASYAHGKQKSDDHNMLCVSEKVVRKFFCFRKYI